MLVSACIVERLDDLKLDKSVNVNGQQILAELERQRKLSEMKMWTKLPDVGTERNDVGVAVGDGKLFAVGGHDNDDKGYDLKSGEYLDLKTVDEGWKNLPDMGTIRCYLGVAFGDGKLFAVGGCGGSGHLKSGEYLDLKKVDEGWKRLPDMNIKRDDLGMAVGNGKLFAVGGHEGDNYHKSGEYLDLKKVDEGWKKLPDMGSKRSFLGVAVGDGKLFAVGGLDGDIGARPTLKSAEYLDLKEMSAGWKYLPDMNIRRNHFGVAVGDGKLFSVGGWDDSSSSKSREYLDLKKVDAGWKELPDMNLKRDELGVAVGDGKLFAVGGWDGYNSFKSGEYLRIAM
eukprot:jgi/Bigna1/139069/aug1.48_g13777